MVDNAIKTAYAATNPVKATLRDTHLQRGGYVFLDSDDPTTIDVGVAVMVAFQGVWFWRDDTDTTSVHDGTTVVVDSNGTRFKTDYASQPVYSVLDKDLTAPPGGEAQGDAYIVGGSATGDWAGQDDDIAIYTGRGYVFATPAAGWEVLVEDEGLYYHFTTGGAWSLRASSFSTGDVDVEALEMPGGLVVEAEQDTPPGGPAEGVKYIVGTSPTGAWVGHNGEVAIYRSAAWVYLTPSEGWTAYNKDTNSQRTYSGSAWVSGGGKIIQVIAADIADATGTTEIPSDTTAPLSTEGTEIVSQAITPASTANKVLVQAVISVSIDTSTGGGATTGDPRVICALFRGTTCIAVNDFQTEYASLATVRASSDISFNFLDSPATASSVTYSIRIGRDEALDQGTWYAGRSDESATQYASLMEKNQLTLMEVAV